MRYILRNNRGGTVGFYDDYINRLSDRRGREITSLPSDFDWTTTQRYYKRKGAGIPSNIEQAITNFKPTTSMSSGATPTWIKVGSGKYLPYDKATGKMVDVNTGQLMGDVPQDPSKAPENLFRKSPGSFLTDVGKGLSRGAKSVSEGLRPVDRGTVPEGGPLSGLRSMTAQDIEKFKDMTTYPTLNEDQMKYVKEIMPQALAAYTEGLKPVDYSDVAKRAREQYYDVTTADIGKRFGAGQGPRPSALLQALGAGGADLEAQLARMQTQGEEAYRGRALSGAQFGGQVALHPQFGNIYQPPPPPPAQAAPQPSFGQSASYGFAQALPDIGITLANLLAGNYPGAIMSGVNALGRALPRSR